MALLTVSLAACDKPAAPAAHLVEGQAFPSSMLDFIPGRNGAPRTLDGRMVVLNIWATWCAPCRREMPALDRLSKSLDPARFVVIGLSTDDDAFLVSEFLGQNGIGFPNFLDRNGKLSRQLGLRFYPETFVIAPDRTLLRRMTGLHDWDSPDMVATLERLYAGQQRANRGARVQE